MQAGEDTLTIAALRGKLEQLPGMLSDGIRNALGTMIPAGMSWSRQPATTAFTPAESVPAQQPLETERGQPSADAAPEVDIPIPSVFLSLRSIDRVWGEWKQGESSRASLRKLYQDHGDDWSSTTYCCKKAVWLRKRKLICAVIGIKAIESLDDKQAVNLLNAKRSSSSHNVNRFAEKLPCLEAIVHPSGKYGVQSGGCRPVIEAEKEMYCDYLKDLRKHLQLGSGVTLY